MTPIEVAHEFLRLTIARDVPAAASLAREFENNATDKEFDEYLDALDELEYGVNIQVD